MTSTCRIASERLTTISTDFLIVGAGIAGLRAAIALAPAGRVLVLTKADATESNTGYAQGGIAAAIGSDDGPALHAADTIAAGDGLCDEAAVRVLVEEGPRYVRELVAWGAQFDVDAEGRLALGLEAAHSVRRIVHAGDATGREIGRTLWKRAVTYPSIETTNHSLVTDLLVDGTGVCGVGFFDDRGARHEVRARATLLATGGAGQVFRETTNPAVATGDGVALAYHAGARVADLEFVQFHPTALNLAGAPRFLISEAVRGEGARLVNARGEPFMAAYHPDGDLAPRDVVARAIVREVERTGGSVCLTLAHLDRQRVRDRFPTIAAMCRQVGLDLATDPFRVGPAAHYLMGGIETDDWARRSLPGLLAAGETACTGVHGANRLASNSLLEGLVFGARAAEAMQQPPRAAEVRGDWREAGGRQSEVGGWRLGADVRPASNPQFSTTNLTDAVRDLMWRAAGVFRTREGLAAAVAELDDLYHAQAVALQSSGPHAPDDWRQLNLGTVGGLIARAALRREESRGVFFFYLFGYLVDLHWNVHLVDRRPTRRP